MDLIKSFKIIYVHITTYIIYNTDIWITYFIKLFKSIPSKSIYLFINLLGYMILINKIRGVFSD